MQVIVPFAASEPKTRLGPTLSTAERDAFAHAMLVDVLWAITETGHEPTVVSTRQFGSEGPLGQAGHDVEIDDRPLSVAVNDRLPDAGDRATAVVMADLALATPASLEGLFAATGDVVIAPGRGGGTNALVVREPSFRVDYHGASVRDHREIATEIEASVTAIDSYRLGTDIDEPADLVEVLLHSDGRAAAWLRERGFSLETGDGRVRVDRPADVPSNH